MKELTQENYFEDDEYMSVSQFKKLEKCELNGLVPFDNTTFNPALAIGSYVDAYVEGTLEKALEDNPNWFVHSLKPTDDTIKWLLKNDPKYVTINNTLRPKELVKLKELYPNIFYDDKHLKADFAIAKEICEKIDNDPVFSQFMSGEKQLILTGEIGGVPFKGKLDSFSNGIAINDLKVMRSIRDSHGNYVDFISQWGYDIQGACYQELVRQNFGVQLPFYICVMTKETPIDSAIINIDQVYLDRALYRVESQIKHLYDVKMGVVEPVGCGVCKTCISLKSETPIMTLSSIIGDDLL